jgi:hypothetical protein
MPPSPPVQSPSCPRAACQIGACGTAAVLVPIASITDANATHEFGKFEVLDELRKDLQAIQMGEKPDAHGWMEEVEV